jgi:hypothetical protein
LTLRQANAFERISQETEQLRASRGKATRDQLAADDAKYFDAVCAALDPLYVGCRNVPGAKPDDKLADLLTTQELVEVFVLLPSEAGIAEADLKNSRSPRPSPAASSAANVEAESASTAPAPANR